MCYYKENLDMINTSLSSKNHEKYMIKKKDNNKDIFLFSLIY